MKIFNNQFCNFQSIFKNSIKKLRISHLVKIGNCLPAGRHGKLEIPLRNNSGQSLIEILVGLAIGAILIGGAGFGISFMLKSTTSSDDMQAASGIVRQTLDEVRSYASANWQNIYGLTKGLDTQYFLNASGTTFYTVQGKEGFLSKDVTDGLIGKWGLDEATGTIAYDMSGNGNDGTLTNSPTRATSTCWVGYCLNFDGTNYVELGTNNIPSGASSRTFSVWVNVGSSNSGYRAIFNEGTYASNQQIQIGISSGKFNANNYSATWSDTATYTTSQWYHLVLTYDGSNILLYKDGIVVASATGITLNTTIGKLTIGANPNAAEKFNGTVDDVRIYNRALTITEVKNLYESKVFSAYFSIENVCRSNDSSSTITDTEPCQGGSIVDPTTEEIIATAEWNTRGTVDSISLTDYATRWKNDVFHQTDWSGGSGVDGPLTDPTTQYSSSTNVDTTTNPGSVRIFGL